MVAQIITPTAIKDFKGNNFTIKYLNHHKHSKPDQ